MSRYVDPIDTIYVDIPAGYCLDRFSSALTHLVFVPWSRAEESLHVDVRPQELVPEAPSKVWIEGLARGLPPGTPLSYLECSEGMAVAATLRGAHGVTRVAFIRGLRLEATVEHRGAGDDADALAVLPGAVRTLFIPLNHYPPAPVTHVQVAEWHQAFKAAYDANDMLGAVKAMTGALRDARLVWLSSLADEDRSPDMGAAFAVAEALALLGKIGRDLVLLRRAEEVALRVPGLLRRLGLPSQDVDAAMQRCRALHSALAAVQARIVGKPGAGTPRAGVRDRANHLCAQAVREAATDLMAAAKTAGAAVEDYLLELAQSGHDTRRARDVVASGDVSASRAEALEGDRRDVARRAWVAARYVYLGAMDRQDAQGARETSAVLLALSEFAGQPIADAADRALHARSMLAVAGALQFSADPAGLREADALLLRVRGEIDRLPPDPALRIDCCRDHAWVKLYLKEPHSGRALCDEALAVLAGIPAESGIDVARSRRGLLALRSQLVLEDDAVEALALAREAVDTPAPPSTHLLTLAICEHRAGLLDDALVSLRRALEVALADNPLGQDMLHILFVGSVHVEARDSAAAMDMHDAAEALLDAQRGRFTGTDARIAFDEAERHREVAHTLIGRLIAANALGEALEASDRSRARVLLELLDAPPRAATDPEDSAEEPAAEALDAEPVAAFRSAARSVRRAAAKVLRAAGAPLPLDRALLVDTVRRTGRPALLYQPEGDRVHMFCILPEAHVIVAASPLPLAAIDAAIASAQAALGVFAVARARGGGRLKLADVDDDRSQSLQESLDILSEALIAPFTDLLAREGLLQLVFSARGITLLPYRELALVPYALLHAPNDRLLIELAPLSQMPSIASLRALLIRKRPPPRGCLVYGAPAVDANHGLEPLPGAAAEAERVASLLRQAGLVPPDFVARVGMAASGSAFRNDAADAALVHLACHAATREPASASALYLSPSVSHDGLLHPHEIADGQLANALVFLSACQTGLGRPTADGVIGLGRAFLQAGALAAVLSLWRVADAAAVELAHRFYRAALGIGAPPVSVAAALQQAMLETRSALRAGAIRTSEGESLDDHPAHWAPFMLLGEASLDLHRTLSQVHPAA